jgi:signal transduction histidine kinase
LVATGETCVLNADEEMIGELIAVLVKNSIEAIGCDGRIEVDVTHTESQMEVRVADSGPGITVEQAAMAMDPYYSGREAGRGLGLGLCRADRIARLHGGELSLAPALAGCVATLRLPVA